MSTATVDWEKVKEDTKSLGPTLHKSLAAQPMPESVKGELGFADYPPRFILELWQDSSKDGRWAEVVVRHSVFARKHLPDELKIQMAEIALRLAEDHGMEVKRISRYDSAVLRYSLRVPYGNYKASV